MARSSNLLRMDDAVSNASPVAIGGLGGSGTRVVATLLQEMGWFLGDDMNLSLDNLCYVLLFGRRDILLADDEEMQDLVSLFYQKMATPTPLTKAEVNFIQSRMQSERIQHGPEFLQASFESFQHHCNTGSAVQRWGWKVPYTYVLVDKLIRLTPNLRYIHISRGGLNMAFSKNVNQLKKWGPILLNRDVELTSRDALSFWCCVHRRVARLSEKFPKNILHIRFEDLVQNPQEVVKNIAEFVDLPMTDEMLSQLCCGIKRPATFERQLEKDWSDFRSEDLAYVKVFDMPSSDNGTAGWSMYRWSDNN